MLFAPSLVVAGESTNQAREALYASYSRELKEPGIAVAVKGAVAWHIYVAGEVKNPNEFTGTGPLPTLTQAIARAPNARFGRSNENRVGTPGGTSHAVVPCNTLKLLAYP